MKQLFSSVLLIGFSWLARNPSAWADNHATLTIGSPAPDFKLPGVDGKNYSLASFKAAKVLVVVFTCNHCPTSQAYENRLIQLARDYSPRGVAVVAIMPNDPKSVQLNELGYSDLGDTFEEMKLRSARKHFNFPYLFDGAAEKAANAYGPVATPHVFIFDIQRKLQYQGRVDDVEKPTDRPSAMDARNAIEALLAGREVKVKFTKVFGCSIKWMEKQSHTAAADSEWALQPVALDTIGVSGIRGLLDNHSDKLYLINIWASWCGPCFNEFPGLVTINRMYRMRDFQFISISADDPKKKTFVTRVLQYVHAANTNYLFNSDNKFKLVDAVDPKWDGAIPYTILVEPGGKIVYSHQGSVDPSQLKTKIVDDPFIGRFY